MPARPVKREAPIIIGTCAKRTGGSLLLKEGGAERRKIEWLEEPQLQHKRSSFFTVIPNLFRDPQIIENDSYLILGILLSQEIMRLRRILSPASYGGTLFQKRA